MAVRPPIIIGQDDASLSRDSTLLSIDDLSRRPLLTDGTPSQIIITDDYQPRVGELVRLNPATGAMRIQLPYIGYQDIGRSIVFCNVSDSYNTVTIVPFNGMINGRTSYSIAQPYFYRKFIAMDVETQAWLDTSADLGAGATDLPSPWFSWNGVDLSQFGTTWNGSNVTSGTWSVVNAFGHNWISGSCTTNGGAGPYAAPRDVPNQGTILPIATLPPTADYFVSAEVKFQTTISTSRTGCGVVLRWATGNTGYVVMRGSRDASGSGWTHLTGVLSPGTSPEFMEVIAQYDDGPPNIGEGGAVYGGTSVKGQAYGQMLAGTAGGGALWTSSIASARAFFGGYSVVTSANMAGLIVSNMDTQVGTSVVYFRNIRCYRADVFGALM